MMSPAKSKKNLKIDAPLAFIFLAAQFLVLFSSWRYLPPQVPLFYSRPWGEEQLVSPLTLFILPGLSLAVILINAILNSLITQEEVLIRRILTITAVLFSSLCFITLIQIVKLVI